MVDIFVDNIVGIHQLQFVFISTRSLKRFFPKFFNYTVSTVSWVTVNHHGHSFVILKF